MEPNYYEGDRVLYLRLANNFQAGDMVERIALYRIDKILQGLESLAGVENTRARAAILKKMTSCRVRWRE